MKHFEVTLEDLGLTEEEITSFGYVEGDSSRVDGFFRSIFGVMGIGTILFAVLFIAVLIFIIVVATRNYRAAKKSGMDPFTMETDLMARAANSALLAPKKNLEEKLLELDDLHKRGIITRDEFLQARRDALGDK